MRLYARAEQRSAALRQYRQCMRILEEELGVGPSAGTTALYEQLRAAAELDSAGSKTPRASTVASRPKTAPPAFLDDAVAPTSFERSIFVGREPELARLSGYLDAGSAGHGPVAFVIGGPGRGKTALLRAFAEQAMVAHPDLLVVRGA